MLYFNGVLTLMQTFSSKFFKNIIHKIFLISFLSLFPGLLDPVGSKILHGGKLMSLLKFFITKKGRITVYKCFLWVIF